MGTIVYVYHLCISEMIAHMQFGNYSDDSLECRKS